MTGAFALMHSNGNRVVLNTEPDWRLKEELIYEILKELFDKVKEKPIYNVGVPDYEVNNHTIIEVKCTTKLIDIEQFKRYRSIGKEVFIVVIEDIGITELSRKYIITVDDLIELLPDNLKEKYIIIKNDILS